MIVTAVVIDTVVLGVSETVTDALALGLTDIEDDWDVVVLVDSVDSNEADPCEDADSIDVTVIIDVGEPL